MIPGLETPVGDVLATASLASRPMRAVDAAIEAATLASLAAELGEPSRHALQRAADAALQLCGGESAGVRLVEPASVDRVASGSGELTRRLCRWHALAGRLRDHLWEAVPCDVVPDAMVIDSVAPQLVVHPARHYRELAELHPLIVEALLVPMLIDTRPVGVFWVMTHQADRHFDSGDCDRLVRLAQFAAAAVRANDLVDRLRTAGRHKDEFLTVLSHEMRNPLAAMSNAARYLALSGTRDAGQDRARDVIQRQLQQITRLGEDLLDVARIGRGTLELRTEPTDLADAVRRGREAAAPALAEYDRTIDIDTGAAPLEVDGDVARLTQVVTNLLTNAARGTRSGGRARLTLLRDGDEAVLRVSSDTGGMAAGWAEPAGDPFVPPADPLTPVQQRGVGLTLARHLTELHGGRVATLSVNGGHDNAFEARFPLRQGGHAGSSPREARHDGALPRAHRRRERVLIVDDCVDSSDSLALLLRTWGHEVRTAQGATAALRLEWEFEPHAVILDIEMPGKNGYEVAAELRVRRRRDLMLVALSGHAREEDRARALAAGFDHHLTKPANIEMLRRLLT